MRSARRRWRRETSLTTGTLAEAALKVIADAKKAGDGARGMKTQLGRLPHISQTSGSSSSSALKASVIL